MKSWMPKALVRGKTTLHIEMLETHAQDKVYFISNCLRRIDKLHRIERPDGNISISNDLPYNLRGDLPGTTGKDNLVYQLDSIIQNIEEIKSMATPQSNPSLTGHEYIDNFIMPFGQGDSYSLMTVKSASFMRLLGEAVNKHLFQHFKRSFKHDNNPFRMGASAPIRATLRIYHQKMEKIADLTGERMFFPKVDEVAQSHRNTLKGGVFPSTKSSPRLLSTQEMDENTKAVISLHKINVILDRFENLDMDFRLRVNADLKEEAKEFSRTFMDLGDKIPVTFADLEVDNLSKLEFSQMLLDSLNATHPEMISHLLNNVAEEYQRFNIADLWKDFYNHVKKPLQRYIQLHEP